jgi:hypothetical protein
MYVKVENGEVVKFPYSMEDLRSENTNISFPENMTDEFLASYNVFPVFEERNNASTDLKTERITESIVFEDGVWKQKYNKVSLSNEESAQRVRNHRDSLLRRTDWTALSDVTMPTEMATYRQALRDITDQEGFPLSVTWPTAP